jgi:hypothetical protein
MNDRSLRDWWGRRPGWPHLDHDTLLEVHVRRVTGQPAGADDHDVHLKACPECAEAFEQCEHDVTGLGRRATAAADAAISPERLARQLEVIARRIDGHAARVLPFPAPARAVRAPRSLRRWVAMAAACGLVFGLAAGRLLGPAAGRDGAIGPNWAPTSTRVPQMQPTLEPALADERLLGEIDAAIARTLHQEFRVLDELTPREPVARGRR